MKKIPIEAAKRIANDYEYPEVVIFAYDPPSRNQHVTTYGKTVEQCKDAAQAGNYLKKALGWPDELCHAKPSRGKAPDLPALLARCKPWLEYAKTCASMDVGRGINGEEIKELKTLLTDIAKAEVK